MQPHIRSAIIARALQDAKCPINRYAGPQKLYKCRDRQALYRLTFEEEAQRIERMERKQPG